MSRIKLLFSIFCIACIYSNLGFSQVVINELEASNTNDYLETTTQLYVDWIEIYNTTDSVVDISNYFVSDDPDNIQKYQLPNGTSINPKGHLMLFADGTETGLHTNFKLSSNGEYVVLTNNLGSQIDSIAYNEQLTDVSYGRISDGNTEWGYFEQSTPNKPNLGTATSASLRTETPIIDTKGGVFESSLVVSISGTDIKYTTDGSEPGPNSTTYSNPISIDATTVLRARSYANTSLLPSNVVTETYLINEPTHLPIIAISTSPDNLFNDTTGVYVNGLNYDPNDFWSPNYYNDWQKPANFEYFDTSGNQHLNLTLEYKLIGELRNYPVKSFRIIARPKYGHDFINYPFFENRGHTKFESLLIRHGGWPDLESTILRDGFVHSLAINHFDLDFQSYNPCLVYYNGEYYGIHNMREKIGKEYLASLHNVDPNSIDLLEDNARVIEGSDQDYLDLMAFTRTEDMKNDSLFKIAADQIDMEEFLNYIILQTFIANNDWPDKNVKFWKSNEEGGKWRWIIFDTDFGLGLRGDVDHNTIRYMADTTFIEGHNPIWSTELFRNLLQNESFKGLFIQKFNSMMNGPFNPDKTIPLLNEVSNNIDPEIARHAQRWSHFNSYNSWQQNVDVVRNFLENREPYIRQYLNDYFNLEQSYSLEIRSNDWEGGKIYIEGIDVDEAQPTGLYNGGLPIQIQAVAQPGYRFLGWHNGDGITSSDLSITLNSDSVFCAEFAQTDQTIIPVNIDSDLTLTADNSPYLATQDIIVPESITLSAEPGVVIEMVDGTNFLIYGNIVFQGSDVSQIIVTAHDPDKPWGAMNFLNTTDSSYLSYTTIEMATRGYDEDRDKGAISGFNTIINMDYVNITDVYQQPIFAQESSIYLTNSVLQSRVTGDLINVKRGYAVVDGCEFIGNDQVDTDAIDYDGITGGIIANSEIHSFFGFNSDAIDLGEASKNIIVRNNFIHDCTDKGISIGQASSGIITNNIIVGCDQGIGIKDSLSSGTIDKNTLYGNNIGVAVFQKNAGNGGGNATIQNTIISRSAVSSIWVDEFSGVTTDYSLSDNDTLSGNQNLFGDPEFINTVFDNFELKSNSLAINNGNPLSPLDDDNSITDIGAIYTYSGNATLDNIFINEIMASNSTTIQDEQGNFDDWFEIYNANDVAINIAGLFVSDSLPVPTKWKIKETNAKQTRIPANGFGIIWADKDTLDGPNHVNFKLAAGGEEIILANIDSTIIDSYVYSGINADRTVGRYADGSENWRTFNLPSPGESNRLDAPMFSTAPILIAYSSKEYRYEISSTDLNGDNLLLEVIEKPTWLTFINETNGKGQLTGFPENTDLGEHLVILKLSDGIAGNEIYQEFTIFVSNPISSIVTNEPLTFSISNPVQNILYLKSNQYFSQAKFDVLITNELGVVVYQEGSENLSNSSINELNLSSLQSGIYFLSISTPTAPQNTFRFFKK